MPLLELSSFTPPLALRSSDLQSMIPALFRKAPQTNSRAQTLELQDGDALELRWFESNNQRLAIVSHGLEGSCSSSYVQGMTAKLSSAKWDVLAWNMRGCGGTPNRLISWYHSGQSNDLETVINEALTRHYERIVLIGFSIGGNITLKYLGEMGTSISNRIKQSVVISVPMDLRGCAETLARPRNYIYMQYLLRPLRMRMREKSSRFPGVFNLKGLSSIKTFKEFDARFTAPFHGFSSVDEYWERSSSLAYLEGISIPTLAISALDDPFLSASCFPTEIARSHPYLFLETPEHGGHVGFIDSYSLHTTWIEKRTLNFLEP